MPNHTLILRHSSHLRQVDAGEVLAALPAEIANVPRTDRAIDTAPFNAQVEQDDWQGQARALALEAADIHEQAAKLGDVEVHYFGLAEVPHVIGLGAFLGDELPVVLHDWDRDRNTWTWPREDRTIRLTTKGLPTGEPIPASGSVVLRLEISFPISDEDVRTAIGSNHLGEVRIVHAADAAPEICKVRSAADLLAVREEVRKALAALRTRFPNCETIHMFAAAPVSACFALGQELKPRNSPPIQTYRFRKVEGQPSLKPALELSGRIEGEAEAPLTEDEKKTATQVRVVWREAMQDLENYVGLKREAVKGGAPRWYELLSAKDILEKVRPFPGLPPVTDVVPARAHVADEPVAREFSLTPDDQKWHLSDRMLLGFHAAAGGNADTLKFLIRLFLFHEYVHEFHSLTKLRAPDVGTFANCLEFIDYTADTYALLHQLDMERGRNFAGLQSEEAQLKFLVGQVHLLVSSFWAFDQGAPIREMQVRRVRRYMNWYWRLAQLERAKDLTTALHLFNHPPQVEIGGLQQVARNRRLFVRLDKVETGARLELALVLENHKLHRVADSTTTNLNQLAVAFQNRDGRAILRLFQGVLEEAKEKGGELPRV